MLGSWNSITLPEFHYLTRILLHHWVLLHYIIRIPLHYPEFWYVTGIPLCYGTLPEFHFYVTGIPLYYIRLMEFHCITRILLSSWNFVSVNKFKRALHYINGILLHYWNFVMVHYSISIPLNN